MLVAGTFASWSRNLAAVGRSTGSLLRAVINTSIKYRLTPGIGKYRLTPGYRANWSLGDLDRLLESDGGGAHITRRATCQ